MPEITIKADDGGSFSAYLATPSSGKGPGVLVIQEIFGVNPAMREITDGLAAQGFTALCPDIFWRQQPGIQLTDKTQAEWGRAFELFQGFDEEKGIADLKAALAALRALPSVSGKVGTVGFCLGGRLAYLMATRSNVDAAFGYYGVGLENNLHEAASITHPLLLHIAEQDEYCPPEAQAKITAGLGGNKFVTIAAYPGVNHAFARPNGQNFNAEAAEAAGQRSLAFLRSHLA